MLLTYSWLKEFIDTNLSPEEIADLLTNSGNEVEEIKYQNEHLHHVVVGKILKIERHPNAEKLVVCQVDIGSKITQIITAATNVFEGALVPVSLPGARLINGVDIEISKLRGIESYGMFCSGEEIGVTDDYYEGASVNGILILKENYAPGTPIDEALGLNEIILDINVTSNRPDCMSVLGIARELSALLHKPIKEKNLNYETDATENVSKYVSVDVKSDLCPRYLAAAVKDIKIKKSPLWMRKKLFAVGIKPINNMVDITNYVLIECGQPMHAFDADFLSGKQIVVREALKNEQIKVLNQNSYELNDNTLVIADSQKPVVIAGVIGGINSCVSDNTKTSVLEAAVFDRKSIRITSKRIGVRTDSSARFEKGVDLGSPDYGMKRALSLVYELNAGTIVEGVIEAGKLKPENRIVKTKISKINGILGLNIESDEILEILNNLGLKTTCNGDELTTVVPPYRDDIENDADISEEVIRMYGYNAYDGVEKALFSDSKVTVGGYDPVLKKENDFRNIMICEGFYEAVNYSFCNKFSSEKLFFSSDDERFELIKISNPISEELGYMRTSMAYSLLSTIAYNQKRGNNELRFFEAGRVYLKKGDESAKEIDMFAFASDSVLDFYNYKGIIERLLVGVDIKIKYTPSMEPYMHPGKSADIILDDGRRLVTFGEVHPKVLKNFDVNGKAMYAEINLETLLSLSKKEYAVKPISKFPMVERDIAVIVDETVSCEELSSAIKSAAGNLFVQAKLFDVYRNESIGKNKKSMAFSIRLADNTKTLSDEEIQSVIAKVLKSLEYRYGAKLR